MAGIFIETRKVCGKTLVYQFEIEAVSYTMHQKEYTSNKWLRFEDWLEIYDILDEILVDHLDDIENYLEKSYRSHKYTTEGGAKLKIAGSHISRSLKNILGKDKKYLRAIIVINITKLNIKKLLAKVDGLKESPLAVIHDEYDPATNDTNVKSSSITYRPSICIENKVPNPNDICENEPYSPKPVESTEMPPKTDDCQKGPSPIYQPSKISKTKITSYYKKETNDSLNDSFTPETNTVNISAKKNEITPSSLKKKLRKCETPLRSSEGEDRKIKTKKLKSSHNTESSKTSYKDKQKLIFGSDDSTEEKLSKRRTKESETRQLTKNTLVAEKDAKKAHKNVTTTEKSDNTLTEWLSKEKNEQTTVKKEKPKVITSHYRIAAVKELRKQRAEKEKQTEMLKRLVKPRRNLPANMEILTLKHLSVDDISKSYMEVKPILDDLFEEKKNNPTSQNFYGVDHLILQNLVEALQYRKCLDILSLEYEPQKNMLPQNMDLYITHLIPEWILQVFMKEYKFSKKEALQRILDQDDLITCETSD